MKVLHLTLKRKWYDMVLSGEKKEEYREVKDYWVSRLVNEFTSPYQHEPFNFIYKGVKNGMWSAVPFDVVQFKNGYSSDAPTMTVEIENIDIEYGKEKWGAEQGKTYFVIKLGKILEHSPF